MSGADAADLQLLRRRGLDGLADADPNIRKRAARSLVGNLRPEAVADAQICFVREALPEVYKWLGMALARAGGLRVVPALRNKRATCVDPNARDWMIAAEAVADPYTAGPLGERMLLSNDVEDRREGAIRAWGLRSLLASTRTGLQRMASESDEPDLRRWGLLALHQHGIGLDSAILLDNLGTGDYVLREWSLHSLVRFPTAAMHSRVLAIVERASEEHPRVLEWAIHAAGSADPLDRQIDTLLIAVHAAIPDAGVREACLSQLGQRMNEPAAEYLEQLCAGANDGGPLVAMFSLRSATSPPLPATLAREIERATARINPEDPGLRYFYQHLPMRSGVHAYIERVVADPMMRVALRGRLSEPEGGATAIMAVEPLRVGIIVALKEEYDYLAEVTGLTYAIHSVSRHAYYYGTTSASVRPVELIVNLVGRKGSSFAAAAAQQLLADHAPHVIVSLGVSGALHPKDGRLADVVIGESTTAYLENFKAQDGEAGQFELAAGTETFRSDSWLVDRAERLDIEDWPSFATWRAEEERTRRPLNLEPATVLKGPIAAGPGVVASEQFKAWIRGLNRGFLAVDMESTGVAQVSWTSLGDARPLLIRGISDAADPAKDTLDTGPLINYRRLAMQSAARYLLACITSLARRGCWP